MIQQRWISRSTPQSLPSRNDSSKPCRLSPLEEQEQTEDSLVWEEREQLETTCSRRCSLR